MSAVFIFSACFNSLSTAAENIPSFIFVASDSTDFYQVHLQGFRDKARKELGKDFRIDLINTANLNNAQIQNELSRRYDVAITLGPIATNQVIKLHPELPIVALEMNQSELKAIHHKFAKKNRLITGVFRDQLLDRFAIAINLLVKPQAKVGILLSQSNKFLKHAIEQTLNKYGHEGYIFIVRRNESPQRVLDILAPEVNVIISLFDDQITEDETVKAQMLIAFRHHIPVIGLTRKFIELGAIAAIYSEPFAIGEQAFSLANQALSLKTHSLITPVFPEKFSATVNDNVLRSFGITLNSTFNLENEIKTHLSKNK